MDGWLHQVYESAGRVWLEHSTDNGTTWIIGNNGKPLDNGEGKCPSIDWFFDGHYNLIVVAFQQKSGSSCSIQYAIFKYQDGRYSDIFQPARLLCSYQMIILLMLTRIEHGDSAGRFILTYEEKNGSNQGINWIYGTMGAAGLIPPMGGWTGTYTSGPNKLQGTSSSSINATVNLNKQIVGDSPVFRSVYEENNTRNKVYFGCYGII